MKVLAIGAHPDDIEIFMYGLLCLLKKNNIEYEKIIEKVKYEGMWNELVFRKFNSLLRIDENKLRNELNSKILINKKYEFNLSEMLIEIKVDENIDKKYKTQDMCTISLEKFRNDSDILILPCDHIFNFNDCKKWLLNNSHKCPICRESVGENYPKLD